MKKFLTILSSIIFISCCTPQYPIMPYTPKLWKGISEEVAICRESEIDGLMECILANSVEFDEYIAMKVIDLAMVQNYIVELQTSCKEWNTEPDTEN